MDEGLKNGPSMPINSKDTFVHFDLCQSFFSFLAWVLIKRSVFNLYLEITMSISSVAHSSTVPLTQLSQLKSAETVEGSRPDGDGDKDDLRVAPSATPPVATSPVTGTIGRNVNVVA